jgi:enolase-phosphatase E1
METKGVLMSPTQVRFSGVQHILLDIEGTVSDVRFVYDVMFPYARNHMRDFVSQHASSAEVAQAIDQVVLDSKTDPKNPLANIARDDLHFQEQLLFHLERLMDEDSKTTGLKALQGLIWKEGFESGLLKAELFPDVRPALQDWISQGYRISIYSSGSILAQKLFFGHTTEGDLTGLLSSFFDTTIGKKQDCASYTKIAEKLEAIPSSVLFVSDIAEELIAAMTTGFQTVASIRPHNRPLSSSYSGPQVQRFKEILLHDRNSTKTEP